MSDSRAEIMERMASLAAEMASLKKAVAACLKGGKKGGSGSVAGSEESAPVKRALTAYQKWSKYCITAWPEEYQAFKEGATSQKGVALEFASFCREEAHPDTFAEFMREAEVESTAIKAAKAEDKAATKAAKAEARVVKAAAKAAKAEAKAAKAEAGDTPITHAPKKGKKVVAEVSVASEELESVAKTLFEPTPSMPASPSAEPSASEPSAEPAPKVVKKRIIKKAVVEESSSSSSYS